MLGGKGNREDSDLTDMSWNPRLGLVAPVGPSNNENINLCRVTVKIKYDIIGRDGSLLATASSPPILLFLLEARHQNPQRSK
jgi:hypothetical protein